jgi:hypothetical protein
MEPWRGRQPDFAIAVGLAAVVLVAFSGVLGNGFVSFDDPLYITENSVTQQGLSPSNVVWAFTTGSAANWHPLTWLSVMLDVDLFGLNPAGHHAMSVALHGLNTALVFAVMRRLRIGRGASAFAAAVFGLHPVHVESVAWAAERKDVLALAFGLLALLAYIRYAEAPSRRRMAAVTGLLLLGLMAKPMLVTLPFVLLLLDWWPLRRVASPAWLLSPEVTPGDAQRAPFDRAEGQRLLIEKAPLFAVVLLSSVVTYLAQETYGVVLERLPLPSRLGNGAHSYVVYLRKFLLPTHLSCFYPMIDLGAGRIALAVATLAVFTLLAWRLRATRPYLLVGWLWFLGALVPMIGLVQAGGQAYADRYTYFPYLGLGLAFSLGLAEVVRRARLPRLAVLFAAGTLFFLLGVATWKQTLVWRSTDELFQHAVVATGRNWFIRLLLAAQLVDRDAYERAEWMLQQSLADGAPPARIHAAMSAVFDREHRTEDALREVDAALAVEPDNPFILLNRGIYLTKLQRDREAVEVLQRVIALDRSPDPTQRNIALRTLARAQARLGRGGANVAQPPDADPLHTVPR